MIESSRLMLRQTFQRYDFFKLIELTVFIHEFLLTLNVVVIAKSHENVVHESNIEIVVS